MSSQHGQTMAHDAPFFVERNMAEMGNASILLGLIRSYLEFYFSPENLATDFYMRSMLLRPGNNGAIPIEAVANFPKIRELHAMAMTGGPVPLSMAPPVEPGLVLRALEGSTVIGCSECGRWVWPNAMPDVHVARPNPVPEFQALGVETGWDDAPPLSPLSPSSQDTSVSSVGVPFRSACAKERTTIILREVPDECTEELIMETFTADSIRPKAARPEVGNVWYVMFDSEELALAALTASKGKLLAGRPLRAGLKSVLTPVPAPGGATKMPHASPPLFLAPIPDLNAGWSPSPHPDPYALQTISMPHSHMWLADCRYPQMGPMGPVGQVGLMPVPPGQVVQVGLAVPPLPMAQTSYPPSECSPSLPSDLYAAPSHHPRACNKEELGRMQRASFSDSGSSTRDKLSSLSSETAGNGKHSRRRRRRHGRRHGDKRNKSKNKQPNHEDCEKEKEKEKAILTEENFPALVKAGTKPASKPISAYADALKKAPSPAGAPDATEDTTGDCL